MPKSNSLEFTSLPLFDASIRLVPSVLLGWELESVFEVATHAKDRGWTPKAAFGFESSPGGGSASNLDLLDLSVWRIERPDGREIHFQPNLVRTSWKKDLDRLGVGYCRFDPLLDSAVEGVQWIESRFEASIPIKTVNISYRNIVEVDEPSTFIEKYLAEHLHQRDITNGNTLHNYSMIWHTTEGIDLRFQVVRDSSAGRFILETAGGISLERDNHDWKSSLVVVHNALQSLMRQSISDEAKQLWGLLN